MTNFLPFAPFGRPIGLPEGFLGLPTTASFLGRPRLVAPAPGTTVSEYFLGRPLGLVDLTDTLASSETTEGAGAAAKGMTVVGCDWVLGGRPGRRLSPLDTDLGFFIDLDLKVPGGRPRPLLTDSTGSTAVVGGGGSRETKTGWAFGMRMGLCLGGRPRPLWVKGVKGR